MPLSACRLAGGSAVSRREWGRLLGVAAILAFCAIAARPAVSENWVTLATHGITTVAVDADSVTTVEGLPGTMIAWFRVSYAVMLDCSPPRGCLASSQRIQYRVICSIGVIAPIQRTLLDLAGNVLAQSEVTPNVPAYAPPSIIEAEMVSNFCSDPARRR